MSNHKILIDELHVSWYRSNIIPNIKVISRGYAFYKNDFYQGQDLVDFIASLMARVPVSEQFGLIEQIVPELNGGWALIVDSTEGILASVDRNRCIPLLYTFSNGGFILGNSINSIIKESSWNNINETAALEFLLGGFVSGRDTIFKGIYEIQPGEIIKFNKNRAQNELKRYQYFRFFHGERSTKSEEELKADLRQVLDSVSERVYKALKNRDLYLPLSGGVDSRLIAYWLKKHGINNVTCFTYGGKDNPQTDAARKVAESLGFDWYFIQYDKSVWNDTMANKQMAEYWEYTINGISSPHIQDFPALLYLNREFNFNEYSVFIPGHVAESWASTLSKKNLSTNSYFPPQEYHSPFYKDISNLLVSALIYKNLNLWPVKRKYWNKYPFNSLIKKIESDVSQYYSEDKELKYIEWGIRNRISRWIVNSVRAYEFIGANFFLPLADYEILDFFSSLPNSQLVNRGTYQPTLINIFKKENVLKDIEIYSGLGHIQFFKDPVKEFLRQANLFKPLYRIYLRFRSDKYLAEDSWFSHNKEPYNISIGEAVSNFEPDKYLPRAILDVVKQYWKKPVYSIQSNGLLTVAVLSKMYKKYNLKS